MGWLIFLGGAVVGGIVGIFVMCIFQINRGEE